MLDLLKRIKQLCFVVISLGIISTAPTTAFTADRPQMGGTLVVGATSTPRNLNPAVQSGTATGIPGAQLFATPLRFDENWNPQPYLAESWVFSDNGLSLTLNLRKNAVFHDGEPITSEDVAFSIETIKNNHPFKSMFDRVETIETPDAHTAILRLTKPHPGILLAMSSSLCAIIPKHVYEGGEDAKKHPKNLEPVGSNGIHLRTKVHSLKKIRDK